MGAQTNPTPDRSGSPASSGWVMPALVVVLAISVLGGAILYGSRHLESALRDQMVNRDGEILDAVTQSRQSDSGGDKDLAVRLQDTGEQFLLALEISQLRDTVMAVRLFDADGHFVTAVPTKGARATLDASTLEFLRGLHPASRYDPKASWTSVFMADDPLASPSTNTVPILEVNIPLHGKNQTNLLAVAQLVMDAHDLMAGVSAMHRQLAVNGLIVFVAGGSLIGAALVWAFRRLHRSNLLLRERSENLLRANHELTLAAKTGALGAVTAHLIHGLSNPLANLQQFVASRVGDQTAGDEWDDALAATRRMQELVHEVVRVLSEQGSGDAYEVTLHELSAILRQKMADASAKRGVVCEVEIDGGVDSRLTNHQANIVLLVLENLAHNAIQVSASSARVKVQLEQTSAGVACRVIDQGPGFPASTLKNLFSPCRSTKGGAGLGLAISKQLACHLGADLSLVRTSSEGSEVVLALPGAVFLRAQGEILGATASAN